MFSDYHDRPAIRRNPQSSASPESLHGTAHTGMHLLIAATFGRLQTDPPTRGATSREPSTAENLPISPPALESPSNDQSTTNSPPRGCQPADNSAKNLPMAEDPSRSLVAEGISNDTSSMEELSDNIRSNQHWRVHIQVNV